ncbi:MAG: energy transducer TonB [Propionivibrio sp.]|nr:energy transducer TonB [Propionivibrio sp.]
MPHRLLIALTLSLALHFSLLVADALDFSSPPPARTLQASLRMAPDLTRLPEPPPLPESLLKNTLDAEAPESTSQFTPPPPSKPSPARPADSKREIRTAQRKLSEHIFYPPEAIAHGMEGDVHLIVKLTADGQVEDVHVAASSGFPLLDNAAIKAAYAMGRLPGSTSRELILPVIFRLQ